MHLVTERAERLLGVEQRLRGGAAHRENHFRLHDLDLAIQERQACRDLVVLRQAVLGRPAFDHVADEHLLARQLDGFEDLGQQLARSTHERTASLVFGAARPFSDHDEACGCRAFTRDSIRACIA